ncbi:MAG: hypothetical protein HUU46_07445 [Candidatus Hydrogenedentes bacterium]|nr:hypothetical protein [Candidatus Hydrogenedentota bacterium]
MSMSTGCNAYRVALFESEVQAVAGDAVHFAPLETGGELYGYRSRGSDFIIAFATPPGPHAVHEACFFRKDLTSLLTSHRWIVDNFRLGLWGAWHSHHYLGLSTPSQRDIESAAAIAKKNGMDEFLIFILTIGSNESHRHGGTSKVSSPAVRQLRSHGSRDLVCVNSFVFHTDSELLSPISVESIPFTSPHRLALQASDGNRADLHFDSSPHPSDCICFATPDSPRAEGSLPSQLEGDLLALPPHLRECCEVTEQDGEFFVTIRFGPNLKFRLKHENNNVSERILNFAQYLSSEGWIMAGPPLRHGRFTIDSLIHDRPDEIRERSRTDRVRINIDQDEYEDAPGENQPMNRGDI